MAALGGGCGAKTDLSGGAQLPPEVCDGIDNDGDGAVDEDIPDVRCGLGTCQRTAPGCVEGVIGTCIAADPTPERCDGLDNDCDGSVDEDLELTPIGDPVTVVQGPLTRALELVDTGDGLLAILGSLGTQEMGIRRLSFDGELEGEFTVIPDVQPNWGPTATPSANGRFLLTVCTSTGFENRLGTVLLDPAGTAAGPLLLTKPTRSCGATESWSLWTGQRHVTAWAENSSAPTFATEVLSSIADEANRSATGSVLLDEGGNLSSSPHLVRFGNRILMVSGFRIPPDSPRNLVTWILDLDGNVVTGPTRLETPTEYRPRQARALSLGGDRLAVVSPDWNRPGLFWGELDATGQWASDGLQLAVEGSRYDDAEVTALPGGGHQVVASTFGDFQGELFDIDSSGDFTSRYRHRRADESYFASASAVARDGRRYLLYATDIPNGRDEVRLITLDCR